KEKTEEKSEARVVKTPENIANKLPQVFEKNDKKEGTLAIGEVEVKQTIYSNVVDISTAKMIQILGEKENETPKTNPAETKSADNILRKKTIENIIVGVKNTQNIIQKKDTLNPKLIEDSGKKKGNILQNKTELMPPLGEIPGEKILEKFTKNIGEKVAQKKEREVKIDVAVTEKSENKSGALEENVSEKTGNILQNKIEQMPIFGEIPGEKILANIAEKSDNKSIVAAESIVKIGSEIVERLMLVQAVSHAKQEVIITFKEDTVLPGTQLSVVREGSSIYLDFFAANLQSFNFLTANHSGLRNFLLERLQDVNIVNIEVKEGNVNHAAPRDQRQKHQRESQKNPQNDENLYKS
ncbi:MAG: hypothetical protein LBG09_02000, partial [Puniceicoccales bacterium]|nr:hypothetical protein [Puniceicoccales bacterium]